jgi:hypothetical protein
VASIDSICLRTSVTGLVPPAFRRPVACGTRAPAVVVDQGRRAMRDAGGGRRGRRDRLGDRRPEPLERSAQQLGVERIPGREARVESSMGAASRMCSRRASRDTDCSREALTPAGRVCIVDPRI